MAGVSPWVAARSSFMTPQDALLQRLGFLQEQGSQVPTPPEATSTPAPQAPATNPADFQEAVAQARARHATPQVSQPAPISKGSGLENKNEGESKLDEKGTKIENLLMTPGQWNQALGNITGTDAYQSQAGGLNRLEDLIRLGVENAPPTQADLSPLMDLTNAWSRNGYKSSYQHPVNQASENLKLLLNAHSKLQDDRRDLAKTAFDAVGKQKAGTAMSAYDLQQIQKVIKDAADPNKMDKKASTGNPATNASRFITTFQSIPSVKAANDALISSREIMSGLNKNNWVNDKILLSKVLNAAHLYPISNLDVNLFQGGPGVVEKLDATFNRLVNNEGYRPEDRKLLQDYAQAVGKYHARVIAEEGHKYVQGQGPEYGYDYGRGKAVLGAALATENLGQPTKDTPPDPNAKIRVVRLGPDGKPQGRPGSIVQKDFDPKKYQKVQ